MKYWILFISLVLTCAYVASAGNISVSSSGSDYIIWQISGDNHNISIDGIQKEISGIYYGQYDLSPSSKHIGCDADGECITHTTITDGITLFTNWIPILLLITFCCISYFIPISYAPAVILGVYLIGSYLPERNSGFYDYLLVGILLIMGLLASIRGMRK